MVIALILVFATSQSYWRSFKQEYLGAENSYGGGAKKSAITCFLTALIKELWLKFLKDSNKPFRDMMCTESEGMSSHDS
jgi:hypothetical protein